MNLFKLAFRRLFIKGEHNTTRIISLITGLSFGIILLSEVFYYYSFDSFYPDANRIYVVHEQLKRDDSTNETSNYPRTSGAIAIGLKDEVPGIEAASRLNSIGSSVFYTEDLKSYKASFSLSDEYLFDVLPRPVISGNPKEILISPMCCMVSDKIANDMGGNVIDKTIELKSYPNKKLTIKGVFKALPENTNYKYDILISMVSTGQFTWDGTNNWIGNDRYYTCVKLAPGVNPDQLKDAVRKMQEKHQDIESIEEKQSGMTFKYMFIPIQQMYVDGVKKMIVILSIIASSVLLVSLLNYIMLTLSALIKKAKNSAIYKTCGAQRSNLTQMIFIDNFLLFIVSLLGASFVILWISPLVESQVGHSLTAVMNPYVIWPTIIILCIIVLVTGLLPGYIFSQIPVTRAFQNYKQKRNKWKLALLGFQLTSASFILTTLVIVYMQYNKMLNTNHGYQAKGVYYGSTQGIASSKIATLIDDIKALPEVEKVGLGYVLPVDDMSGNNIYSPDGEKELFNIADFYMIDENYLSILNIPILTGSNFTRETVSVGDVLISQKCADRLKIHNKWNDNLVGKSIYVTEHGSATIQGVYSDFIINSISNSDNRPSAFFYYTQDEFIKEQEKRPSLAFKIIVKTYNNSENEVLGKLTQLFNNALPHNDAIVKSLEQELIKSYEPQLGFRNAMLMGNIIVLLISVIGLMGYTTNEALRRSKELAIRKINGATIYEILKIFILDLGYIVVPATLLGLIPAWHTSHKWIQNFTYKINLHWGIFIFCSISIIVIVIAIAVINYIKISNQNPVEALKYE